ncbi:hypothetical protein GF406_22410 [candidate division KSB1 bacterium]|nr:hypothetical protein [candidate division KSB1 bacterium]
MIQKILTHDSGEHEFVAHLLSIVKKADLQELQVQLQSNRATILRMVVYGTRQFWQKIRQDLVTVFEPIDWPLCWIPANSEKGNKGNGLYLSAITGPVKRFSHNGRIVATTYDTGSADVCFINGLQPADRSASRDTQTNCLMDSIQAILQANEFDMTDIVRTWFYNDDILSWYSSFNNIRTGFYQKTGIIDHRIPASTGVGIYHPESIASVAHILAVKAKQEAVRIETVDSPLQCPATRYGSSFSRAAVMKYNGFNHLYVSGTASIDSQGNTVYVNDLEGQIQKTYEVVAEILSSCQMSYTDVVSGVIYLARYEDIDFFEEFADSQKLPVFPAILAENIVCRGDLLFEIEVEAIKVSKNQFV